MSYKNQSEYDEFSQQFLQRAKSQLKAFPSLSRYCETRFLSLGQSLNKLITQWEFLLEFFESQKLKAASLKIPKKQINKISDFIKLLKNGVYFIHDLLGCR